ncbi:hypothetical protein CPK_ORF00398 [Chlamydia pneumoniae LPCoLN]|uniref:Uncharacterized protein n=1 Tax=Chlamydia pneumoniae TaxID=83558 RepID=Q9K1V8_CHLPN|nr:hypothetical protein CP_0884 [Chlamydia pneumoniae AR39]ACZ32874.1 hypothetical protein CPK_ORF00398 [Chlamydia pneumoniae LPCoLN]CRI33512.1 Uncharacterized protein BN1224_Wien1_A_10190 [Chlamydia pneumoniae]CRI36377.1 Uncharacterized protein BN1224_CM1_A_10240 [Chlamydia pneumoniae]CRI37501.1 Uncharacterized protein BN1224_CV14_A_10200 [Chlamydia pneumoniae]
MGALYFNEDLVLGDSFLRLVLIHVLRRYFPVGKENQKKRPIRKL